MPLDLSQLKLQKLVLELRYEQAFLLWDRAGTIAAELRSKFPEIKTSTAQAHQQQFSLDRNLTVQLSLERAFFQAALPPHDLEGIRKNADDFFSLLISQLKLRSLTRIGLLSIYERHFESREAAADFVLSCQPSLQRQGKFFNVEGGRVLDPEFFIRWEGETLGCSTKLHSLEQSIEAEVPVEFEEIKPIKAKRRVALLEIDYYAHADTPVSKFSASAIIENWTRAVRRDLEGFVGA